MAQVPNLTLVTAHITTQATTTLQAAVSGVAIGIWTLKIACDGNGATTSVTIQDSAGTNLIGTGIVFVLRAGDVLDFPERGRPYFKQGGAGNGIQVVTGTGNGPIEVIAEVVK